MTLTTWLKKCSITRVWKLILIKNTPYRAAVKKEILCPAEVLLPLSSKIINLQAMKANQDSDIKIGDQLDSKAAQTIGGNLQQTPRDKNPTSIKKEPDTLWVWKVHQ